jgi:hypothetical protein
LETLCCTLAASLVAALSLFAALGAEGLSVLWVLGVVGAAAMCATGAEAAVLRGKTGVASVSVGAVSQLTICAARLTHIGPKPNAWFNCI